MTYPYPPCIVVGCDRMARPDSRLCAGHYGTRQPMARPIVYQPEPDPRRELSDFARGFLVGIVAFGGLALVVGVVTYHAAR